jgi:hypothetical protein
MRNSCHVIIPRPDATPLLGFRAGTGVKLFTRTPASFSSQLCNASLFLIGFGGRNNGAAHHSLDYCRSFRIFGRRDFVFHHL